MKTEQLGREERNSLALPGACLMTTAPTRTAIPRYVRLVMTMASRVPLGMAFWGSWGDKEWVEGVRMVRVAGTKGERGGGGSGEV